MTSISRPGEAMVVAQTVALLAIDVAFIVTASFGSSRQNWWFLHIPSGSFVLETAVGTRDIMHVFIEVLLVGISVAAYLAAVLICRMRRERRFLKNKNAHKTVRGGHNDLKNGVLDEKIESTKDGFAERDSTPSSEDKNESGSGQLQRQAAVKQWRSLGEPDLEGLEMDMALLLLLVLVVIGQISCWCNRRFYNASISSKSS